MSLLFEKSDEVSWLDRETALTLLDLRGSDLFEELGLLLLVGEVGYSLNKEDEFEFLGLLDDLKAAIAIFITISLLLLMITTITQLTKVTNPNQNWCTG